MLYLNGIYFPISYYYDLLGRAFQKVFYDVEKGSLNSDSVKNLVSVSITGTGKILWPTQKEQRNWMNKKANQNKSPWKEQADYTLKNTKILYHFLRSFQDLLTDIFQQGG